MAELFSKDKRTISEHIQNIFKEGELSMDSTVRNFRIVQKEGTREVSRLVDHYNLDVIISVGYRIKSHRGTQFRIWATARLKEFLIKGFALADERLKRLGGGSYFNELLARIRDIRSSEKVFWRKVLDIYATSIDYDPNIETSKEFFLIVQNKTHSSGLPQGIIIRKKKFKNRKKGVKEGLQQRMQNAHKYRLRRNLPPSTISIPSWMCSRLSSFTTWIDRSWYFS